MSETLWLVLIWGPVGLLIVCETLFFFPKLLNPFFRLWARWSDWRFYKKTGIDPRDFPPAP